MAQLRYQQQSLFDNVGSTPARATNLRSTQFTGMQEAANYQSTRANVKNRLAKMLDPIATSYIENEALKYSAENPVTQEQLKVIVDEGDVSDLEGNEFTVRGKILKKLRASQVSNQLLIQAKTEMLTMQPDIESGALKHSDVLERANQIIDGYTGTVGKLDPQVAVKFRASAASLGNTLYQKAIELDIKRNQALTLNQLNLSIENAKQEIQSVINNNVKEFNPQSVKLIQALEKEGLNIIASSNISVTQIPVLSQKFKDDIRQLKIDAIANYVNSNDFYPELSISEKLNKIKKLDAGPLSGFLSNLENKDREKVESQVLKNVTDIEARKEKELEQNKLVVEEKFEELLGKLTEEENKIYPDIKILNSIKNDILNLKTIDGNSFVGRKEIKNLFARGATISDEENLLNQINQNFYQTFDEVRKQAFFIGANKEQMQKFSKNFRSSLAREERQIENLILGITSEGMNFGVLDSSTTRQRLQKAKRILYNFEKSQRIKLKENFNRFEFLNEVYTNLYDKDGTLKTEVDSKYETLRKSLYKNPIKEMQN